MKRPGYFIRETEYPSPFTREPRIRSCTWYDSTGNYPVRTMDARGNEVRREVDATSGLVYNVTDPAGQKVEYAYDTSKRVTGVQTTDGDKVYKNA